MYQLPQPTFLKPPLFTQRSTSNQSVREELTVTEEDVEIVVPEITFVERIVEVPEIRFVEKIVPVVRKEKRIRYVEGPLPPSHPRQPLKIERIVTRPVEVPVECVIERQVPSFTEEVVEIERHVPRFVDKPIERKMVDHSQPQEIIYERKIHYENVVEKKVPVIHEVVKHVPKVEFVEVIKEIPQVEIEEEIVEVPRNPLRKVERFVDTPIVEFVDKVVDIPVRKFVNKYIDITVEQKQKRFVEKIVETDVERVVEKLVYVPPEPVRIPLPVEKVRRPKLPPNSPFARPSSVKSSPPASVAPTSGRSGKH